MDVNPGFRVDSLLTARIVLPDAKYPRPEQRTAFYRDLVDRMAAIPGVESAAAGTGMPLLGGAGSNFVIEGQPAPATGHENAGRSHTITTNYFQTVGIPLRRGRYLSEQDTAESLPVVVINERLAQQFFPNENPIGKRLKWSRDPQSSAAWKTIVGVIADTRANGLGRPASLEMFAPLPQEPRSWMVLAMRTHAADPTGSASALRGELRALDRDQPITQVRSMRSVMDDSTAINRLMAVVVGVFAGIAMMMASIGIYAVVAYSVGQRTQEFGIRMALGAGSRNVVRLVLKQALWMVGIAFVIGLPAAALVSRLLGSFLNGVEPRDPVIFIIVPVTLAAVAMFASFVPARRATRVDPVTALRYE
jgi:putative ABC transport system permease protein